MRVYLANQFSKKQETAKFAEELRKEGFIITSTWLNEPDADANDSMKSYGDQYLAVAAKVDVYDISSADAFVIFTVDPDEMTKRGGRHVETGMAMAMGKKVIVCGPRENIFHHLPEVIVCKNLGEVVYALRSGSAPPPSHLACS